MCTCFVARSSWGPSPSSTAAQPSLLNIGMVMSICPVHDVLLTTVNLIFHCSTLLISGGQKLVYLREKKKQKTVLGFSLHLHTLSYWLHWTSCVSFLPYPSPSVATTYSWALSCFSFLSCLILYFLFFIICFLVTFHYIPPFSLSFTVVFRFSSLGLKLLSLSS